MSDGKELVPIHSELFSVQAEAAEHQSENTKLVGIAEQVHRLHPDAVMVRDRGGDRDTILGPLVRAGIRFVVRGMARAATAIDRRSILCNPLLLSITRTPNTYRSLAYPLSDAILMNVLATE